MREAVWCRVDRERRPGAAPVPWPIEPERGPAPSSQHVGAWVRILRGPHIGRRAEVVAVSPGAILVRVSEFAAAEAGTRREVALAEGEYRRAPRRGRAHNKMPMRSL
jgi:hypothetical protein